MSCQVEQIADCGDTSSIARALFVAEREDSNWLSQCQVSLSPCGNLLAIGFRNRLCVLTSQWISSTNSNTYLISWSGTLPSDITNILVLSICPSKYSSQNGPDWYCIIAGLKNGSVGFYTHTGHLLLIERLDEKPVMKVACHTGTYGTLPDDIHVIYQSCVCIISGSNLFQTLRVAKAHLAKVQAGIQDDYSIDSRNINIRKWSFNDQEHINDAAVVGLELKNSYDHLLAASTYGGYDTWYRSIPPMNTLILVAGLSPYIGFHYALEGGTTPPLQDVARAVANKIKSALPGWLGGGGSVESSSTSNEPQLRSEPLSMRRGVFDPPREGSTVVISPDKRLAAFTDSLGRVAVFDINKGHIIKLFKGYRDAQCAFIQIFDADKKKPQLSLIKEIRRALFLIIYNPKKGLIDIRLMQRGNRIAVFTATKNGMLLYNTCGLVGAEKDYTHKKLNMPEFQCVLLDPDGKIKKFNIPFFHALDGKHLERSKDLHTLRDLRDHIKKNSENKNFEKEILDKASQLKTLELKKHCIEILIRNYEVAPNVFISCLNMFWDSLAEEDSDDKEKVQTYFANLALVTLFYRYIKDEDATNMQELITKVRPSVDEEFPDDEQNDLEFHLLEDDSCILERLLILAQENGYKHKHARVTFADNNATSYKEFISCFQLEEKCDHLSIKSDLTADKLDSLSSNVFTAIFKTSNIQNLGRYITYTSIDTKEIVKLLIMNLMHMELEELSIEVIESFITILYYISRVTKSATHMTYNEISPWWEDIRSLLVEMSCPLRSMIVAMTCKAVCRLFEVEFCERDDEAWESVTKEYANWSILIGKLEDISILSIVLLFKDAFKGHSLPKLHVDNISINLKYIYTRGKGSVTELIAKWLCGMGVPPEAVVVNELLETQIDPNERPNEQAEESSTFLFLENNRVYVDDNPKIFKWLSLLRQQFPLSTISYYIIANMCWEYAMSWQNNVKKIHKLNAILRCLKNISDLHLRLGLFTIIWSTYLKQVFESTCRLVNKVGKLPKDPLCLQDIGFTSEDMIKFLESTTQYLDNFLQCAATSIGTEKRTVQYERIWDKSVPSLVEVAQDTKHVNNDILNLNYQVSCTIYYQCHYNIKVTKPLDHLFDIDFQYIIEALAGNAMRREINMIASEKIRNPRLKFITKLIRASIETISCKESEGPYKLYDNEECQLWIERITTLSEQWGIENDFISRQQLIGFYHLGYDTLAENLVGLIEQPQLILPPILAITTQRLKRNLEHCSHPPEWIVSVPPHMYKRMQNTTLDTSIPAHPSLPTTIMLLQKILHQIEKQCENLQEISKDIKLAELMIETCDVLIKRKF